jgi:UDPglucose 6-dehydrogenase
VWVLPTVKTTNSVNLKYVFKVARDYKKIHKKFKIVIIKSTVPVTTGDKVEKIINSKVRKKLFDVVSNPEFLREVRQFVILNILIEL